MPHLPFELINNIGVYASRIHAKELESEDAERDEVMARLRELALVSRSWLPLCRAVIFSQYSLWDMEPSSLRAPQFLYMLTHPLLAVYVTHVRIIPRIFDDFTRRVSSMVPSVSPRTTILTMDHDGRGDITSDLLCDLLRELPELRELHLPPIYAKSLFLEMPVFPHMANLHSLTVSAVAYNMIQILDAIASSSGYNSSQLRKGVFSLFYHSQIPQPYKVPQFHQALEGIRVWEDLRIKYPSYMLSAASHIHPELGITLGHHRALSRLHIVMVTDISGFGQLALALRGILFGADLPSLQYLDIELEFECGLAGQRNARVNIEIGLDVAPVLSETAARALVSLKFRFGNYGDCHLKIENWHAFEGRFGVPAGVVSYQAGANAFHLPKISCILLVLAHMFLAKYHFQFWSGSFSSSIVSVHPSQLYCASSED